MKAKSNIHLLSLFTIVVCIIICTNSFFPLIEGSTGIMVALYFDPQFLLWDSLIDLKNQYPNVNVLAVINPNNGPGNFKDTTYYTEVLKLQSARITVLGYTFTNYGQRDIDLIFQDINKYTLWYNVDGIFFDEVANFGQEENLKTLDDYANAKGASITMGNPGTDIPPSYIGIMDNYVIYENKGLPDLNSIEERYSELDKQHFSLTSYGVMDFDSNYITALSEFVQYMYVTNDDMPNPYDTLSIHLERLVQQQADQAVVAGEKQAMSSDSQFMNLDIPELMDNLIKAKEALANREKEDALTPITDVENQLIMLQITSPFKEDIQKIKESISQSNFKKALDDITNIQNGLLKIETDIIKYKLAQHELIATQQQDNNDDN
ncbi:MAG TPA: spherulation-specific family 4 protein [Nitrososphaeraceae archaeon]